MYAAIYVRVSTDRQAEQGYSINSQLELCRKKAKELGCLYEEYIEKGYSGMFTERPQLQRLLNDAKNNPIKYKYLIVYKLDRLSRDTGGMMYIQKLLSKYGIEIMLSDGGSFGSNAQDKLTLSLLTSIAQFDNEQRRERSVKGKIEKRKQGKLDKGIKYGYIYNEQKQNFDINEVEAKWVRAIFDWYTKEHIGCQLITKRLNRLKAYRVYQGRNIFWDTAMIKKILHDTTYYGTVYSLKKRSVKVGPRKEKKVLRDKSEWIPVKVPAIISKELWEEAHKILEYKKSHMRKSISHKHVWLLQGLTYCGYCHEKMYVYSSVAPTMAKKEGVERYFYFRCKRNHFHALKNCPKCENRNIPIPFLEDAVWNILEQNFSDNEKIKSFMEKTKPPVTDETSILDNLKKQYNSTMTKKEKILAWFTSGKISEELADKQLDEINSKIKKLSNELKGLQSQIGYKGNNLSSNQLYDRFHRIKNPSKQEKRDIILSIIDKIYVKRIDRSSTKAGHVPKFEIDIHLL